MIYFDIKKRQNKVRIIYYLQFSWDDMVVYNIILDLNKKIQWKR